MSIILNGDGSITGLTSTGISAAQTVTSVTSSALPAGSVIQVVQSTYSTNTSTSSSSFSDTGLTATITPKFATSKILVMVNQNGLYKDQGGAAAGGALRLLRNGSQILYMNGRYAGDSGTSFALSIGSASSAYLDSPATTSATTYKTQFLSESGTSAVYVQAYGSASSITLMEIAA
jgi:hypothetical protein